MHWTIFVLNVKYSAIFVIEISPRSSVVAVPNENLDKWLYSEGAVSSIKQRLEIMIDVASALEYIHHGYTTPVVHCDLKPSNVLFDENMTAHVSDFGIAKLLGEGESMIHTRRKQPGDEMFLGDLNLKTWVKNSLTSGLSEVLYINSMENIYCVSAILKLALSCSADLPSARMNMKQVAAELAKIKNNFME